MICIADAKAGVVKEFYTSRKVDKAIATILEESGISSTESERRYKVRVTNIEEKMKSKGEYISREDAIKFCKSLVAHDWSTIGERHLVNDIVRKLNAMPGIEKKEQEGE